MWPEPAQATQIGMICVPACQVGTGPGRRR